MVWPEINQKQVDPSGWALDLAGNGRAIAYNPKLVPPKLVPKTWDECARPELRGKVVLDPRHKTACLALEQARVVSRLGEKDGG